MANNSAQAFKELLRKRQGGGLTFASKGAYSLVSPLYTNGVSRPDGYKPFTISIHKADGRGGSTGEDLISLTLLVNPSDIQIGNVYISSNNYTRKGWVSTLWGPQQSTISSNGSSPGFYYRDQRGTTITNRDRKESEGFINFLSLVSIFKNNGANFLKQESENDLFKSGYTRIINVMDSIKIFYDGSEYLGEFISFTLEETAIEPYRLTYSFEYVINGISADSAFMEGHVRRDGYDIDGPVVINIQGSDSALATIIQADEDYIRSNAFVGLKEFAEQSDESQAAYVDQVVTEGSTVFVLESEAKTSEELIDYQYAAKPEPVKPGYAAKQINKIREYNENVGQNKTAQEAVNKINSILGLQGDSKVTVEMMNGILMMENRMDIAVDGSNGGVFERPDSTSAQGMTQIVKGTYEGIISANKGQFVDMMVSLGYTEEEVLRAHSGKGGERSLLDTDAFLGYMASAYLLGEDIIPRTKRDGLEVTTPVALLQYHNGPSYNEKVTELGARYAVSIDMYLPYLADPDKPTSELTNKKVEKE